MRRLARIVAAMGAVAIFAACSEPSTKPSASPPPGPGPDASAVGTLAARAIAIALVEPEIRQQILGDMRDSPFSEHKLVLQDYFRTPGGERVLDAIQRAGIDAGKLRSALQGAARIQFYVPNTAQRSSWQGTADVLVAASLIQDPPTLGFAPTGQPVPIELGKGKMPSGIGALFVLQWAEPMFRRWAGPTAAKETIQMPNESQMGSGHVVKDESGRIISTTDDMDTGLFGVTASAITASATAGEPAGTYLTTLSNDAGVCDHFLCDDLEFEFISTATDDPNVYTSAELTGISTDAGSVWHGLWQVHTSRAINGVKIETQVWEVDGDSPNDPFYCVLAHPNCSPGISNWPYMNGQVWSFLLCEDTPQGCVDQFGAPVYPDLEVSFTDRSTPVTTTVTVSPATATINKSSTQSYSASVKDQYGDVIPNKIVSWSSTNTPVATVVSTGDLTGLATGQSGGQASIRASVDGVTGSATLTVLAPTTLTVSPSSAPMCAGQGTILTATVRDQNGGVWTGGTVGWSSSDANVATVSSTSSRTANAVAVGNGQATASAALDGVTGQSTIPVAPCLPTPTSCTLDYIPQPHYLKVAWVNSDASASTEVSILRSPGDWQVVGTDAPGIAQHFYIASSGLYYARVRHVKSGYTSSSYCNTNAKTVP